MKLSLIVAFVGLLPLVLLQPIDNTNLDAQQTQETLETVHSSSGESNMEGTLRDKRTIGPLRQIFPNLSQLVDRKIQMITRVLFRVIGRLVLRGGLGGGGGGGGGGDSAAGTNGSSAAGGGNGRRISITLPTYPPGEDDEDEDEDEDVDNNAQGDTETTTEEDGKNQLDGAASEIDEVRVPFNQDQETAASEDDEQVADAAQDVAVVEDEEVADEQRDKRFLNFNLGGGAAAGASAGGSGGGSGNFLFDIIRLVAGSGNTEAGDEKANSAVGVATAEQTVEKDDGYQAGVPGPITRLFIIANRGIANLMQDLILRLAQTSERIVNFKARLITSII